MVLLCFLSQSPGQVATQESSQANASPVAPALTDIVAFESFDYPHGILVNAEDGKGWQGEWTSTRGGAVSIEAPLSEADRHASWGEVLSFHGTGNRNNPVRRELSQRFFKRELFVHFRMSYSSPTVQDDPEFLVLWLDTLDGGDRATHANVPNIGIHIADRGPQKGQNVFMVRVGPRRTVWSDVVVESGRTYRVVARLAKPSDSADAKYSTIDLWIDPDNQRLGEPTASLTDVPSISAVRWLGFSTGLKTESSDQVRVHDFILGTTEESVLQPPLNALREQVEPGYNGVVWDGEIDFKEHVYPLLKEKCFDCHAGENSDSGRRLDVLAEILGYSDGVVLAQPGRSYRSRLFELITSKVPSQRMPPEDYESLGDRDIALIKAWIDQGLSWDDQVLPPLSVNSDHWAFQPIEDPALPSVEDSLWCQNPIDVFIKREHERAGLNSNRQASRRTLIRRLYLDLLGFPPTPNQVDSFVKDDSPDAYEILVEKLLSSPQYGERWGRYWLDLARWAESQGYQHDIVRPSAWRYRDYVIDSFNSDKPYDLFLKQQLAGDELQPYSDEHVIATGFLAAARISGNQEDDAIQRNDVLVDIVNATSSTFLGLTLECAQCHNHKFDPISQRDYYRMQAFFVRGQLGNLSLEDEPPSNTEMQDWIPKASYDFYSKEAAALVRKKLFQPIKAAHTWGYVAPASADPRIERFPVVNRRPIDWQPTSLSRTTGRLLVRGDANSPGPLVQPGWPAVLGETPDQLGDAPRTALANWLTSPNNPLTARVWVNRLWQYHFGQGLVHSASDFGVEGAKPTHPDLLDWLAQQLIESGWSTKRIQRLVVLSSTYRQAQQLSPANTTIDPDNRLLWSWPIRRLDAEAIRDSVLSVSGEADFAIGGVSVPPEKSEQRPRRSIYLFQQRSKMPEVMMTFDGPTTVTSCSRRSVSTVALQPLFLLNSPFMTRRAEALSMRIQQECALDVNQQIRSAFHRVLGRSPDATELRLANKLLQSNATLAIAGSLKQTSQTTSQSQLDRLGLLCQSLMNLNEFLYIP